MTATQEKRIAELMKTLDCSRAEAIDIIKEDETIDKGGRTYFDLSPEDEKRAKKYANVDTHKRPAKSAPRPRKPNELKEKIVENLASYLRTSDFGAENVEITNKNRMIAFKVGEKSFELMLVEKRPSK